jgi:AcrR family transcriptional regulator
MTTRPRGRPRSDPDRDLRGDLLRTARTLLDEGGVAALTMRELARRAGCTHQAPYHYFEDREALLAALVVEGFAELARRLRLANDLAPARGARAALIASGRAYVEFALSQPGVFRAMFRPDVCNPMRFPAVLAAGGVAHAELDRLNGIAHGSQATAARASILWAHVHGLACLLIDGPLALAFAGTSARECHLDEVARTFADLIEAPGAPPGTRARRRPIPR